jgi:hypothetical protein
VNPATSGRRYLPDERIWAIAVGALASLAPVLMTDVRSGTAGVLAEAILLFAGALFLTWFSGRPFRPALFLLGAVLTVELVALMAHRGLAVFAGTWAPAGALALVTVPALLAGATLGNCMIRERVGVVLPVLALLLGYAAASTLPHSPMGAALVLLLGSAALAALDGRDAVLLASLTTGICALVSIVLFFSRAQGPGHMWPVVLPVQAAILTPMTAFGALTGYWIWRYTGTPRRQST